HHELGERPALIVGLANGLVVEDHAADVARQVGRAEQHLAIGAPRLRRRRDAERREALADGAGALVGGQDPLAGGDERLRGLFELVAHPWNLLWFMAAAARSSSRWRTRRHGVSP